MAFKTKQQSSNVLKQLKSLMNRKQSNNYTTLDDKIKVNKTRQNYKSKTPSCMQSNFFSVLMNHAGKV